MVLGYHSGKILNARTRESRCRAAIRPDRPNQPGRSSGLGPGVTETIPLGLQEDPKRFSFPSRGFVHQNSKQHPQTNFYKGDPLPYVLDLLFADSLSPWDPTKKSLMIVSQARRSLNSVLCIES